MTARCRVCGRPLRSQRYASAGVGPTCARKTAATVAVEPTAPRPTVEHCPGQTAIPLGPTPPDAAVAVMAAALDDYRTLTPTHQQTPHDAAEYAAMYLTSSGWTITPAA